MTRTDAPPVGILGGTFDPVHLGHIQIAKHVLTECALPAVRMLLSPQPPHKTQAAISPVADRLAMLSLAVADHPWLSISTNEVDRGGICYTIDSLRALRDAESACRPVFIMGLDSLLELPTWRNYIDLISEFDLIVVARPRQRLAPLRGQLDPAVESRLTSQLPHDRLLGAGGRIITLAIEPIHISSSAIRKHVASGGDPGGLVSPVVAGYIRDKRLYNREENR
jgi:nicotinate-nucleotide adenylyltransferase